MLPHSTERGRGRSGSKLSFPIVALGASAGGLEPIEQFLANLTPKEGLAVVVVQHLDPAQASAIVTLLQRITSMEVCEATHLMLVRSGVVHVIPPNRDMTIRDGALLLHTPAQPLSPRLPIDTFFRSLALECEDQAIGVVLSGMGSDGTAGLRAIKEKGGLTLAQDPATAAFDSMPESAIAVGMADIIAPAAELPARILAYLTRSSLLALPALPVDGEAGGDLEQILNLLRDRTRNDFSLYKTPTLYRRIERRVLLHQLDSLTAYAQFLRDNPQEIDFLVKELLIGVTNFFRDSLVWDALKIEAFPRLLAAHPAGKMLRAWVPACSTGEEAYSLAILFREVLDQLTPSGRFSLHIYATDLDADAIIRARQGLFPDNIVADVSPERLNRFFVPEERGYRIAKDIREMVTFAQQNIISDPPFTRMDILSCRNLLIYFGPELQKTLLPLFHFSLNPDGLLLLGSAETVGGFGRLFVSIDQKARLYRRIDHPVLRTEMGFPIRVFSAPSGQADPPPGDRPSESLQTLVERTLLERFCPAAVLVNADGDILYIHGRTGKYLEPAVGKANLNIHAMARDGLRYPLTTLIKRALRQTEPIHLPGVRITDAGAPPLVNVVVQGIERCSSGPDLALIVFSDVDLPPALARRPRRKAEALSQSALAEDLFLTRQELERIQSEMQTSLEELKSANEEQQATNEELQSANEELTTSKEEMQSMNEELHSVNAELQAKIDDLMWVNNDMRNLLNSTELAIIFLDEAMQVRRFTPHATQLFKLIPSDVGRLLSDIVTDLIYPELQADAAEVLRSLMFIEKQVATHDTRWVKVRIMPYRTQDNVIDGVVITFIDITGIKILEEELRRLRSPPP